MKQTLNEFLKHGLNRLNVKDDKNEIENGEKYVGNFKSDFDCTYFKTKQEAREMYRQTRQGKRS